MIVNGRDFVFVSGIIERDGKAYVIAKGIDDETKFPIRKDIIRGILNLGGYIIENIDGKSCNVKFLYKADCNGKHGKLPEYL